MRESKFTELKAKNLFSFVIRKKTNLWFEKVRFYISEIESKFENDLSERAENYKKSVDGLTEEEIGEFDDYFEDRYPILGDDHFQIYRNSTIIVVCSFLESSLNALCKHLSDYGSCSHRLEGKRGMGISCARRYLKEQAEVNFDNLNEEWSCLSNMSEIRNCIVHCGGDVEAAKDPEKLKRIIKSNAHLTLRGESHIVIDRSYVEEALRISEVFLEGLYDQTL